MVISKRGAVGTTITWVAVSIFIAVVLILYLVGTAVLAKTKKIGDNKIDLESTKSLGVLKTQYILISVLNSPLKEGKSVMEKIVEVEGGESEYEDVFEEEVSEMLNQTSDIFIFEIDGREDVHLFYPKGIIRSSLYESKVSIFVNDQEVEVTLKRK